VRILLDTHALLWWWFDDPQLSRRARERIADASTEVLVSSASAWEVATKHRLGRLREAEEVVSRFAELVRAARMRPLAVSLEHGIAAGGLPGSHRDPFDRMLAAQALLEDVPIVTTDDAIGTLGARVIW
jgi:PIN domain nuclease of toxin-antitoxin system